MLGSCRTEGSSCKESSPLPLGRRRGLCPKETLRCSLLRVLLFGFGPLRCCPTLRSKEQARTRRMGASLGAVPDSALHVSPAGSEGGTAGGAAGVPEQRVAGSADATTTGHATRPCASHVAARSAASIVDELLPQRTEDVWRLGGDEVVLDVVLLLDVAVAVWAADSDVAVDASLYLTAWSIEPMRGSASIAIRFCCPVAENMTVRALACCGPVCSSSARVGVKIARRVVQSPSLKKSCNR